MDVVVLKFIFFCPLLHIVYDSGLGVKDTILGLGLYSVIAALPFVIFFITPGHVFRGSTTIKRG